MADSDPSDRLLALRNYREALVRVGLRSPEAVLRAPAQITARLGEHEQMILSLIRAANPTVLGLLFAPSTVLMWSVEYMTPGLDDRRLTIHYKATVEQERRLWRMLKAALDV